MKGRRPVPTPPPDPGAPTPSRAPAPAKRVVVTSPRKRAVRTTVRRAGAREIDEQTRVGEVLMRSLLRTQLRLGLATLGAFTVLLGGLPLLFALAPDVRSVQLLGLPLPWLLLGVLVYPGLAVSGNRAAGSGYSSAGRPLATMEKGPFDEVAVAGDGGRLIGAAGKTVWMSFLVRKDSDGDASVGIQLTRGNVAWVGDDKAPLRVGFFGTM